MPCDLPHNDLQLWGVRGAAPLRVDRVPFFRGVPTKHLLLAIQQLQRIQHLQLFFEGCLRKVCLCRAEAGTRPGLCRGGSIFLPLKRSQSLPQVSYILKIHPPKRFATSVLDYILTRIRSFGSAPKQNDDKNGGGEWFANYLRAVHRDIYDDIDHSDAAKLLSAGKVSSLSHPRRKHDLSRIVVPGAARAFDKIREVVTRPSSRQKEEAEVLAKILIDTGMCALVDFCTLLKIGGAAFGSGGVAGGAGGSDEANGSEFGAGSTRPLVVVAYMGQVHTSAVAAFFRGHMGFTKVREAGCEAGRPTGGRGGLALPEEFWDPASVFQGGATPESGGDGAPLRRRTAGAGDGVGERRRRRATATASASAGKKRKVGGRRRRRSET